MKRNVLLRVLACMLAVSMLLGMTACGSPAESTPEASEAAAEVKEPAAENAAMEPAELSYPLNTDKTLSVFHAANYLNENYTDYTQVPILSALKESTGVNVEWRHQTKGADYTQTFNLMLTESVLPDVIICGDAKQAEQLLEDGVILDLTDLIPQYAPDYWAYINSDPALVAATRSGDGKLFGFHSILESDMNLTYIGPVVRQDWLDECGLEVPVTLEDWENVMVTFKDKYGAAMALSIQRFGVYGLGSGAGSYGNMKAIYYVDDNGKVQFAQAQPEWKEYMTYLHKWYDMGLIDKDSFTMRDADLRAKVLNNEVGISFTALSQLNNWSVDAKNENTGANWVGFEYPRTAAGEPVCMTQTQARVYGPVSYISTSCAEDKVITALQWLNYGYTEEGKMLYNFGIEGEHYEIDASGEPVWKETVIAETGSKAAAAAKYSEANSVVANTVQLSSLIKAKNEQLGIDALTLWTTNVKAQKHYLPNMTIPTSDAATYNDIYANIQVYVEEMALKYVLGEESLDNFDSFVDELYSRGLQTCIDIQQTAYDKYVSN